MTTTAAAPQQIRSTIPARLDRLRWSPFHTRMVLGLGTAWILDGLSITVASSVTGVLTQSDTLGLTTTQAAATGSVYLLGEVAGALVFGKLSDKLGRRRIFMWTLGIYLLGTGLSAFAFKGTAGLVYFYLTRALAGSGIGGEYSAINSAIDEMMPARYRGRTDIWINGTYWAGSIIGTFVSFVLLNAFAPNLGWRLSFLVGPVLAVVIIFVRRNLPESPRWLITHGREEEALASMKQIEDVALKDGQHLDRGAGQRRHRAEAGEGRRVLDAAAAAVPLLPQAGDAGRVADDHPVVPVQRDLLHLCPGADEVLSRAERHGAAVRAGVRGRQPGRPADAWATCSTAWGGRR